MTQKSKIKVYTVHSCSHKKTKQKNNRLANLSLIFLMVGLTLFSWQIFLQPDIARGANITWDGEGTDGGCGGGAGD